uniref:Uncharacterized protein n=1 Tax=Rhizophora mucronata TaxID=61149 RepID=A0A2P2PUR9_RHIMU
MSPCTTVLLLSFLARYFPFFHFPFPLTVFLFVYPR